MSRGSVYADFSSYGQRGYHVSHLTYYVISKQPSEIVFYEGHAGSPYCHEYAEVQQQFSSRKQLYQAEYTYLCGERPHVYCSAHGRFRVSVGDPCVERRYSRIDCYSCQNEPICGVSLTRQRLYDSLALRQFYYYTGQKKISSQHMNHQVSESCFSGFFSPGRRYDQP